MVEPPEQTNLPPKARECTRIPCAAAKHFQRDDSVGLWLPRLEYDAARPGTDDADHVVVADLLRQLQLDRAWFLFKNGGNVDEWLYSDRSLTIKRNHRREFVAKCRVGDARKESLEFRTREVARTIEEFREQLEALRIVHGVEAGLECPHRLEETNQRSEASAARVRTFDFFRKPCLRHPPITLDR